MLSELLSKLFPPKLDQASTPKSFESSESFASLPAQSQELSSKQSWITSLTKQLRLDEGEVLSAYQDHLGYWTIGVGRLIDSRKGGGISKEESAYLLTNDINSRIKDISAALPWFEALDDARKGVLINMSFQLGVAGLLQFKTMLAYIEAGKYSEASDSMYQSLWAKQTPQRCNRMSEQMRVGQWQFG
jgi:lysozyme